MGEIFSDIDFLLLLLLVFSMYRSKVNACMCCLIRSDCIFFFFGFVWLLGTFSINSFFFFLKYPVRIIGFSQGTRFRSKLLNFNYQLRVYTSISFLAFE